LGVDFGEKTQNKYFLLKSGDLSSLNFWVNYHYLLPPTRAYNLAYQMHFSDTRKPGTGVPPKVEVMIWLHHTFGQPANAYQGNYVDGNVSYELYAWEIIPS
jgi:hypothetical protein